MQKLKKGDKYIFNYRGICQVFLNLDGKECTICATYIGQDYVGIIFENGIETIANSEDLTPI